MSKTKLVYFVFMALICVGPTLMAQSIALDQVIPAASGNVLPAGVPIEFYLRVTNGPEPIFGITNGFRIYGDSVVWGSTSADTLGPLGGSLFDGGFFINEYSVDGQGADTVGFGGFRMFGTGVPAGFDAQAYRITIGPVETHAPNGQICLDSSFYPPTGAWMWATSSFSLIPGWGGPYCFMVGDTIVPPDTLVNLVQWSAAQGGNNHWYGIMPLCYRWVEADAIARGMSMGDMTGYLATITSQAENDFVINEVLDGWQTYCHDELFWLGGRDIGGWHWTTGEPWSYTNWAPGEPNNVGIETALDMWGPANTDFDRPPGKWNNSLPNDADLHLYWSVVEFGLIEPGEDTLVTPTDRWVSLYCEHALFNDTTLLPQGTMLNVFDPDGVRCGAGWIGEGGSFGFLPVYGDDIFTNADEGAEPGDQLSFKLGDRPVIANEPVYWTENGDYIEVCSFRDGRCQEFDLDAGWHLISWNVDYAGPIENFLAPFAGSVDVVMAFDQGGLMYVPTLPDFATLENVDYNHGYWVRLTEPVRFEVCGADLYMHVWDGIPIFAGWNLVGYWPTTATPPFIALNSLYGALELAYGFDHGMEVYIPNDFLHNTLDMMNPGLGYWVKSNSPTYLFYVPLDCTYVASQPLPAAKVQLLSTSRNFMAVYGRNLAVDGEPVAEGSSVQVFTANQVLCGSGVYSNGLLKFTPVYGQDLADPATSAYPVEGDPLTVTINDQPVDFDLSWQGNGSRVELASLAVNEPLPGDFGLSQNYPNPFNPTTSISFNLPEAGQVTLAVYNILGQQVAVVADGFYAAGPHETEWDGTDQSGHPVSSGVYLYRLQAGQFTETRKMLLMK